MTISLPDIYRDSMPEKHTMPVAHLGILWSRGRTFNNDGLVVREFYRCWCGVERAVA